MTKAGAWLQQRTMTMVTSARGRKRRRQHEKEGEDGGERTGGD